MPEPESTPVEPTFVVRGSEVRELPKEELERAFEAVLAEVKRRRRRAA